MNEEKCYSEEKMAESSMFKRYGEFIYLDGVKTYVVHKGTGENIILINGIAASVYTWRKILDKLAENFHVFCVDYKGSGFSEKPERGYSIDIFTNQILGLMKHFNLDKAIMAGNSLGGEIALNLAVKHPDKVSRLILLNSAGYQKGKNITSYLVKLSRFKLTEKVLEKCMSRRLTKKIAELATFNDSIIDKRMVDGYYKPMKTEGGVRAFTELVKNLSYTEFDYKKVRSINIPTLIIWGKEDKVMPVSDAYKFHKDIKNSKLVILENCGHGPQEEKPDEVVRLINDFAHDRL